jgi:FkbM family methyltransferase
MRLFPERVAWLNRPSRRRLGEILTRYRTQLAAAAEREQRARAHRIEQQRRILSTTVLRQLLEARAGTFARRGADPAAGQAEQALLGRSEAYRAALTAAQQPPDDAIASVGVEGLTWWVPRRADRPDHLQRAAAQGLPLRTILQTREVAPGHTMLDIGANIGRTAIPRVLLGDCQVVYAAEPDPLNYRCLVRNICEHGLRGRVLPDNIALAAAVGTVDLIQSSYIGGHRLRRSEETTRRPTVPVACWTLSRWVESAHVDLAQVNFIKIDAQGCELDILRGAGPVTSQPHIAWQLEVDRQLLVTAGSSVEELARQLAAAFTHFIDLNAGADGERVRPLAELTSALTYLQTGDSKTDIIVYKSAE